MSSITDPIYYYTYSAHVLKRLARMYGENWEAELHDMQRGFAEVWPNEPDSPHHHMNDLRHNPCQRLRDWNWMEWHEFMKACNDAMNDEFGPEVNEFLQTTISDERPQPKYIDDTDDMNELHDEQDAREEEEARVHHEEEALNDIAEHYGSGSAED